MMGKSYSSRYVKYESTDGDSDIEEYWHETDMSKLEKKTLISRDTDREFEDCNLDYQVELSEQQNGHFPASNPDTTSSTMAARWANCYVLSASVMASLGGVLFGYDIGIISGAVLQLRDVFCLSCFNQELVISSMLIGAIMGSLVGGFLIDHCGRRPTIIANSVVFLVGALVLGLSPNFTVLVIGRVLVGFAVSVSATGECIYISEIATAKRRGLLVSLNELGITLGLLLAYLCNFLLISVHDGWRWMFALSAIPAVIQGVGMYLLPNSPRFLMLRKREEAAETVLKKLRGTSRVDVELSGIRVSIASEQNQGCFDLCGSADGMRGRLLIGIGLVFFQQFTGQPNVLYYAPTIFENIGFETNSVATLATVGLGCVKVVMTIIALICVDKFGRRRLLYSGATMMGISIIALGVVCHFEQGSVPEKACVDHTGCHSDTAHNHSFIHPTPPSHVSSINSAANPALAQHNINSVLTAATSTPSTRLKRSNNVLSNNAMQAFLLVRHKREDSARILGAQLKEEVRNLDNSLYRFKRSYSKRDDKKSSAKHSSLSEQPKGSNSTTSEGSLVQKVVGFTALMCYVAAYGFSFGPVTWLMLSEIFPAAVKGRAIALATVFNWGTNLIVTSTFLDMMNVLGVSSTFYLFGVICFLSVAFIYSFVPETKNRTLEQVSADMKANLGIALTCCTNKKPLYTDN